MTSAAATLTAAAARDPSFVPYYTRLAELGLHHGYCEEARAASRRALHFTDLEPYNHLLKLRSALTVYAKLDLSSAYSKSHHIMRGPVSTDVGNSSFNKPSSQPLYSSGTNLNIPRFFE